jgi:hypothetical protein
VLEAFSRDQRRHLEQAAGELGISFIDRKRPEGYRTVAVRAANHLAGV